MKKFFVCILSFLILGPIAGQNVFVEGKIFDNKNRRLLDEATINIYKIDSDSLLYSVQSFKDGSYKVQLPMNEEYYFRIERQAYRDAIQSFIASVEDEIVNIGLERLPGYEFEASVKELLSFQKGNLGKELNNVKVEVYNLTTDKEIIVVDDDPDNTFKVNFERGNQYSILLRKKGYFAKRIEVYVDVEGCILCFEGLGTYASPEIEYTLTEANQRGSIISDIPMKKIIQDEAIILENIYYDYDKWAIRSDAKPALNNLVTTLKRNPIIIELSSHTDSRGEDDYNYNLSQKRAESAVEYIIAKGIKSHRISAKGYGETMLINDCSNGVRCDESLHQENRRTEFKVVSIIEESNFDQKSLRSIIEAERKAGKRIQEELLIFNKIQNN